MANEQKKMGVGTWMFCIGIALFFDALEALISLIPVAGEIIAMGIDGVAFATFWLIFKMNNETYSKKTFIGGFVVGFIPIVNMLPECTLTIIMLYINSKAQKVVAKVPGGQLATQAAIQGHMAKNTVIVNGERKNKSDMGNRNAKPAFSRFQDVPTDAQAPSGQKNEQESKFNLNKPEGYYKNRIQRTSLDGQSVPVGANFNELNRTGQKITDEAGTEKTIKGINYNVSENIGLRVKGRDYSYRSKNNPDDHIGAEYNKDSGELVKMHFDSKNPLFAGRAITDMVERIPPGSPILGGEVSMSTDSFPLLLKTADKYVSRNPGRFSMSQEGEFALNNQGKYSKISKAENDEEKVSMLNKTIDDFNQKTGQKISHARIEGEGDEKKIMIPKIKIVKNY